MPSVFKIGAALPSRLRWYVLAAIAVGVPVVAAAAFTAARTEPSERTIIGVATFFCLAILAEYRPVPIDIEGKRLVSLAFVFIISSQLLFGWEWSTLIGALGIGLAMTLDRSDPIKVAFNSAAYAIAAGLAALPLLIDGGSRNSYGLVAISVVIGGAIFVVANVLIVCGAIGLATGTPIGEVFRDHMRQSGPIFAISIFVAAQAVILWRLSAPLVLLLSAPLFALTLYQRSSVRGRVAEEAASTDSLTGLRNRRAFEDDAAQALSVADGEAGHFTLCMIDIDRFKQVNDRHGHLAGDAILETLARAIEATAPECGYRLGGDEFVLFLPREVAAEEHVELVSRLQREFAARQERLDDSTEEVTISGGMAFYPEHANDLHSLQKQADVALYRSKYNGRARVTVYGPDEHADSGPGPGVGLEYLMADNRLLTTHRLVTLVDSVSAAAAMEQGPLSPNAFSEVLDRWTSSNSLHSQAVATLTVALARRLGVDGEELEHVHLAALLHDAGKIAIPDAVLSKPGPLGDDERRLVERHPMIGYELLRDLGVELAANFVLHHHERWDGAGYPDGLAGAEIPFGSRLILVADAFDALTSDRAYRRAVSVDAAIHEIQSESGRQFDPLVVSALHEHFAHPTSAADQTSLELGTPIWSSSTSAS
jgi:diguanylate cyclase (GGDEF)-like protein